MKKVWKRINTVIHKSNSKEEIIGITKNNKIETDPTIIGNTFNEFFTAIAKKLTKNIKISIPFENFLDNRQAETIFLTPTHPKEIEDIINKLDINKGNDIYGLSTKFLKIISKDIAPTLSVLFNESLETGIFFDHMKIAMITPTLKGGSRLVVSNYPL